MFKWGLINDLADLIYPAACVGCEQPLVSHEEMLCTSCMAELPRTNFHRLPENEVLRLFTGRCRLQKASAYMYFSKGGIVQALMHNLKYRGNKEAGIYMGRLAATDLHKDGFFEDIDYLVPIPLHQKKLKKRGYNQSLLLAQGISEICGTAISDDNLVRDLFSESQTRKSRFARWQNVERIFTIKKPEDFENRHLLLIDDVVTTGSTIEASATKLISIAGVKVSLLTMAVAKT